MKKLFVVALALLCAMAAQAATVNLFVRSSGDGWDVPATQEQPGGFKQQLEAEGLYKDGKIATGAIVQTAYNTAKEQSLVGNVPLPVFAKWFSEKHKLPLGGVIAEDDFRRRAQAREFVLDGQQLAQLAVPAAVAPAAQPAEPEKKMVIVPSTPPVQPTDKGVTDALRILNGKLEELERDKVDVKALKAELAAVAEIKAIAASAAQYEDMAKKLTAFNRNVDEQLLELKKQLTRVETAQGETAKQVTQLSGTVETTAKTVKEQGEAITGLKSSVTALEGKVGGASPLAIAALVAALLALATAFLRKRGSGADLKVVTKTAQDEAAKTVTKIIDDKIGDAVRVMNRGQTEVMKKATEANRTADAALKAVKGTGVWFDFDDSFELALAAAEAGQTVFWHTTYSVEGVSKEVAVSLVPKADGFVNLGGVKNLSVGKGCRLDKVAVKTALRKAAQRGDLVGLSSEELAELQTPAQPDFADTVSDQLDTMPAPLPEEPRVALNRAVASPGFGNKVGISKPASAVLPLDDGAPPAYLRKDAVPADATTAAA